MISLGNIFRATFRRPLGALSGGLLLLLYLSAIFAELIAPATTNAQNLERTYHPPTKLLWDGGLRVQAYELVDPSAASYQAIEGESYSLSFMGRGFEYRLLGLFATDRHLLVCDDPRGAFYRSGATRREGMYFHV